MLLAYELAHTRAPGFEEPGCRYVCRSNYASIAARCQPPTSSADSTRRCCHHRRRRSRRRRRHRRRRAEDAAVIDFPPSSPIVIEMDGFVAVVAVVDFFY